MSVRALAAMAAKNPVEPYSYEAAALSPTDVEIEISHCGICHSDLNVIANDWATSVYPLVPGHEIVGKIAKAGAESGFSLGQRVGVGWQRSACLTCALCLAGHENLCAKQQAICVGHPGGFADRIVTDGRFVFAIPDALGSAETAPLLCGGVTVFAPMRRYGVTAGSSVGVIGIGGLGHLALRFLRAMGCEVTAFSSTPQKREESQQLGAHQAASSTEVRDIRKHAGRFDLLLSTVPARLDWITFIQTLKPNGVLCLVGAPPGLLQLPAGPLLTGQKTIAGSDIGSRAMIREMLEFSTAHKIGAQIETAPMSDANLALDRLRKNDVRYRMVLTN